MNVPFVDLSPQHYEARAEIDEAIRKVIDNSAFIGGAAVTGFERNFAAFCGARNTVTCASGTDALKLALMAVGVRRGDEVVTVPNTFIATVEAITMAGAYPAFVDIDPATYNMSPARLADFLQNGCYRNGDGKLVNSATRRPVTAILPVHLYGLMADMANLLEIAESYGLQVVEDACQAHGATCTIARTERSAGSLGEAAAFSFYPGKNLGAMGEGGAATTNNDDMAAMMRIWREHGSREKYVHVSADGWNGRLDAMQCAILDVKLGRLAEWNEMRRRAAAWYAERLMGDERVVLPVEPEGSKHVYHLYVVRVPERESVRKAMLGAGVGVGLHYPVPLHLQEAYSHMGWKEGDFPEAEAASVSILSLPMFPHITEEQVEFVCNTLKEALKEATHYEMQLV
jgi:dTDP-4-amino-4,6-dideoxygalactose transaminase